MARRNCALSSRRADCRRKKAHLAIAITISRYMRPRYAVLAAVVVCGFRYDGAGPAAAQSWPSRPLTMVVPFAAGGGTDVLGRIVGRRLSEVLGQQVIIENVGGAGGMVGSARVAKAAPDGYQFVLGSRADAINQTLYKNPLYNFAADLAPVVLIADQQGPPRGQSARVHRLCEGEPGDDANGFGGSRLHRPSRLHAAQRDDRDQRHPRSLPRGR